MIEKLVDNSPALERFKALGEQERFPIDLLPGVLRYGIDVARATKGIKTSEKRVVKYEAEVIGYKSGTQMIEVGKVIGQDLSVSSNPRLLRRELREVIRSAQIKRSDRMYVGIIDKIG